MENDNYKHEAIDILDELSEFYDHLSMQSFCFMDYMSKHTVFNYNSRIYYSMSETLNSMSSILKQKRIGDAFAILRKYDDSTMINIFLSLFIKKNDPMKKIFETKTFSDFGIPEIEDWLMGKSDKSFLEIRRINNYVANSEELKRVFTLIGKNPHYKRLKKRCNDFMHYNQFYTFVANTKAVFETDRLKLYDAFRNDLIAIFSRHFACLILINGHHMVSRDYIEHLEFGIEPPEGSDRWLDRFSYEVFNKYIKTSNPKLADEILATSNLNFNIWKE